MELNKGIFLVAALGASAVSCGTGVNRPCVSKVAGQLVEAAVMFKLDVYGSTAHCAGNSVPTDSGAPQESQTYPQGHPIQLDIPPGAHVLVLTTFADAAATQPTGSACTEEQLAPGGSVCFNLEVSPYVRGCPTDATRCQDTCCANGTCDQDCVLTCSPGFANCNGDLADGCETNLATAGQKLCNGSCISANSCCDSADCVAPPMSPVACYAGTCPSPGGDCTYAQKQDSTICGATCCSSVGGTCGSDCSLLCQGNNADCNKSPADGCEADLTTNLSSCGSCGRACSGHGENHVDVPSCLGGACASRCQAGWSNCKTPTAPLPDDGCECNTSGCCGTFCQTAHANGFGQNFYDCTVLNNYTKSSATAAANVYPGASGGTLSDKVFVNPSNASNSATAVCLSTATDCPCWTWSATGAWHNVAEGYANRATPASPSNCVPASGTAPPFVHWN